MEHEIPCENHEFSDTAFCCTVPFLFRRDIEKHCKDKGIEYTELSRHGIVPFLLKRIDRVGLLVGFFLMLMISYVSGSFLWGIDVKGNQNITSDELEQVFCDSGLYLGCYLPNVNIENVENAVLKNDSRLSWISINMSGSMAYVEIRERSEQDKIERVLPYANIIATEDAIVTDIEVFSGMACTKRDTFVQKGELLISGVISKESLGTHLTYAQGHVYGKSFREFEIEIPYVFTTLEETDNKAFDFKLNFFSKTFDLLCFKRSFEVFNEYDSMYAVTNSQKTFPIYIEKTEYRECTAKISMRSERDAMLAAKEELERRITKELSNADILSKKLDYEVTKSSVKLLAEVWYEREIGQTVEFEAVE